MIHRILLHDLECRHARRRDVSSPLTHRDLCATYRDLRVAAGGNRDGALRLEELFDLERVLEAGKKVLVLGGVGERLRRLRVDLREALAPQGNDPEVVKKCKKCKAEFKKCISEIK